ncbi:MAG: hypothetical protein CMB80_08760 [Flammeovirgaceae bacterium]|nr:hypothetical protein [Flammeovirgaceae bacterium]|tara:strand:+ start:1499 stop:1972 length:474 start_codon:yes stop_codon:yes gene_type:complete
MFLCVELMKKRLELLMDVKEIRLINMNYLIDSVGSVNEFADLIEGSASHISQIRSTRSPKNVGATLARRIESAFNKEHGWMDKLHYTESEDYSHLNDEEILTIAVRRVINQLVSSGVYEAKKSMETSVVTSLIVNEYKEISEKAKAERPSGEKALTR